MVHLISPGQPCRPPVLEIERSSDLLPALLPAANPTVRDEPRNASDVEIPHLSSLGSNGPPFLRGLAGSWSCRAVANGENQARSAQVGENHRRSDSETTGCEDD